MLLMTLPLAWGSLPTFPRLCHAILLHPDVSLLGDGELVELLLVDEVFPGLGS